MLEYVTKLTVEPSAVTQADVQSLRDAGFDDRGVLDIVLITSMFAFMNRLAEGLGVHPEEQLLAAKKRGDERIEAGDRAPMAVSP